MASLDYRMLLRKLGLHLAGLAGTGFCVQCALVADLPSLCLVFPGVLLVAWLAGRLDQKAITVRETGTSHS